MTPEAKNQRFWELLGQKLRERRDGLLERSLDDVASQSETGISKSSLSLMENGKQQVSTLQFFELSRVLDFSPTELLAEIEKELAHEQYKDIKNML